VSGIDFQNGFIVGMATRGITRSGLMYAPVCWNDSGIFSHFYIDFKKPVADFSTGMLSESVIVHDSVQLVITGQERVSTSVFKIFVDISNRLFGITVLNKLTSHLKFATGEKVPPFSVHFFVSGIVPYDRLPYMFDSVAYDFPITRVEESSISIALPTPITAGPFIESATWENPMEAMTTVEACSVVLL